MKKIALMLPPMSLEERYGKAIASVAGTFPPLGLLYLGTVLKDAGHKVTILDGSMTDFQHMLDTITREKPDVIGISVMTFLWPKVKDIIARLKNLLPDAFIVIGGVHATIAGKKCLEESAILDAVVYGEGEFTLLELVECLEKKQPFTAVKGLIYRDGGQVKENEPRPVMENIDKLPVPDRSLVPIADYLPAFSQYRKLPVTNMFTTRGCPFRCIFCIPDVLGKRCASAARSRSSMRSNTCRRSTA